MRLPIKINIKPLSVNDSWKGKRYRTDKYKQYCKDLGFLLPPLKLPEPPYEVYLEWGFSSKGSDTGNPEKPTIDIIAKKYGFNDNLIYKEVLVKNIVPKGQEYIKFDIKHYKSIINNQ